VRDGEEMEQNRMQSISERLEHSVRSWESQMGEKLISAKNLGPEICRTECDESVQLVEEVSHSITSFLSFTGIDQDDS